MSQRSGLGRLYIGEDPERGAHPGYRGFLCADVVGVHVYAGRTEWLWVDNESTRESWPMGEWDPVECNGIIPWHRVHAIEWGNRFAFEPVAAVSENFQTGDE
jgi:hypothetical protein